MIAKKIICLVRLLRMLPDQVSLKAKKDALICAYGSRYINTHREQHHINICSRK
nr:unnamed protein product [Callosobruchus analis]